MTVYEEVTNRIVEQLEQGTVPWVKPWKTYLPYNAVSQKEYRGINIVLLWWQPYGQGAWLTYKQARELGGHVRKGEKATRIVYASKFTKEVETEGGDLEEKEIPFLKWYFVFNIEQCEGLPERLSLKRPEGNPEEQYPRVEAFIQSVGFTVLHGGNRAYYSLREDQIHLPHPGDFESPEHYYTTSLHEHIHATGHPMRLDRELCGKFGDPRYAFEELIAEMGAAFLCAHLNIPGELRHADYIGSWIKVLQDDKRAMVRAASAATKAADYLRERGERHEDLQGQENPGRLPGDGDGRQGDEGAAG